MRVIGQFNLGFILAALGPDVFIVDQHASDEIFNFEKLQRETTLNKQPLIKPARLDLSAAEEQTVRTHMDVFLANGFGFCEEPVGDADEGAAFARGACRSGCCLALLRAVQQGHHVRGGGRAGARRYADDGAYAAPARTQLSVGLSRTGRNGRRRRETKTGDDAGFGNETRGEFSGAFRRLRPSRPPAMLTMRACRSSIMIGTALTRGARGGCSGTWPPSRRPGTARTAGPPCGTSRTWQSCGRLGKRGRARRARASEAPRTGAGRRAATLDDAQTMSYEHRQ